MTQYVLVAMDDHHINSMRELKIILQRDWPILRIEEPGAEKTILTKFGDHRCGFCTAQIEKEIEAASVE